MKLTANICVLQTPEGIKNTMGRMKQSWDAKSHFFTRGKANLDTVFVCVDRFSCELR